MGLVAENKNNEKRKRKKRIKKNVWGSRGWDLEAGV